MRVNNVTQSTPKRSLRRGRIFPELTSTPEERARRKAEDEIFYRRCRAIFERVRPDLISEHYGWYIAVEPNSGDYFVDEDKEVASQKAHEKYPNAVHCMFCLNETGATGRI
ncbi:hypothetical protein [Nodularia sp. UHCC 0506]|uniref:hypothetical protein n=1 Tax=Nodularia sp. UHCC 0506 TaxID=3110243 RepID=UPI002B1F73CB|nr:hypothetical protein [Nodularia sp. UHCC 0506]MEA5513052.1 hypothetical protein [Nodularia sp. UHCC 0506]